MSKRFPAWVDGRPVLMDEEMHWANFPSGAKQPSLPPCKCENYCGVGIGAHPAGRCKGLPMDEDDGYNARQS